MVRTALVVIVIVFATAPGWAQTAAPPWKAENLQVFPKDISRAAKTMRPPGYARGYADVRRALGYAACGRSGPPNSCHPT